MNRLLKYLTVIHLLGALSLSAQELPKQPLSEEMISANVAFQIWAVINGARLHDSAGSKRSSQRIAGEFFIQSSTGVEKIKYSENRRSKRLQYFGPREMIVYQRAPGAAGEADQQQNAPKDGSAYSEAFRLTLPLSGDFLILLLPQANQKHPFKSLILPHDDSSLKKNQIRVVNFSAENLAVRLGEGEPFALKMRDGKSVSVPRKDVAHLRIYKEQESPLGEKTWKEQLSKAYSLVPDSKTFCIIYKENGRLKLQFCSGIR